MRLVLAVAAGAAGTAAQARDLNVVATIKPIHSLVAGVMDGRGTPSVLIANTGSPHTYALRPSDAQSLQRADVIFRVSPHLEVFTVRIASSLQATTTVVSLAETAGVRHLARRTGATFEPHDHDHSPDGHSASSHDQQAGKNPGGHDPDDDYDPHVWLDPDNAKAFVRAIVATLSARSPEDATHFRSNGDRLLGELDDLATRLSRQLLPFRGRPIVVFHDGYQYFERRFGLTVVGAITVSPEAGASARRLSDLRRKVSALGAVCIATEPQFSPKLVAAVAEGLSARTAVLDPVGATLPAGRMHYFATLQLLADTAARCLSRD